MGVEIHYGITVLHVLKGLTYYFYSLSIPRTSNTFCYPRQGHRAGVEPA